MKLIIHRGTKEIGGSCVELQSGDTRIVVDLGQPLYSPNGDNFDARAIAGHSVEQLLQDGVLPKVSGLYHGQADAAPAAILISHAHQDHYGFSHYAKDSVPCYAGQPTADLIRLTNILTGEDKGLVNHVPFSTGKSFRVGPFKITPYLVDHSAVDAYAFAIEAEGKTTIYSGDFRLHGRIRKATEYWLEHAPKQADVLLLEGTMFGRESTSSPAEDDLELEIAAAIKNTRGLVTFMCSGQNISRLTTFYRAAARNGRHFVIDFYTAEALAIAATKAPGLPQISEAFRDVWVYYPHWTNTRFRDSGRVDIVNKFAWKQVKQTAMADMYDKTVMLIRGSSRRWLEQLGKQAITIEYGTFFYSQWLGYKKQESMQKFLSWVQDKGATIADAHVSGHVYVADLKYAVGALNPKQVIPIHTFHPERYQELGAPVRQLPDGEALTL